MIGRRLTLEVTAAADLCLVWRLVCVCGGEYNPRGCRGIRNDGVRSRAVELCQVTAARHLLRLTRRSWGASLLSAPNSRAHVSVDLDFSQESEAGVVVSFSGVAVMSWKTPHDGSCTIDVCESSAERMLQV